MSEGQERNGDRDYGALMAAVARLEAKVDQTNVDLELVRGEVRTLNEAVALQLREDQRLREESSKQWDEISKVSDRATALEQAAIAGAAAGSKSGAASGAIAARKPAAVIGGGMSALLGIVYAAIEWGPKLLEALK